MSGASPRRIGFALAALLAPALAAQDATFLGRPGKLVLCGGGRLDAGIRARFMHLAERGTPDGARLVVIPTASRRADDPTRHDAYLEPWRSFDPATLVVAHARGGGGLEDVAAAIDGATAVWLGGGDQSALTAAYLGTSVEAALHRLLARGGVLGGTSAGAACMSAVMIAGGKAEARIGSGFDFLPSAIVDQHFSERGRANRLVWAVDAHPGCVGYGIDEGTALVVDGRTAFVSGRGKVHVFLADGRGGQPPRRESFGGGSTIDLETWRRAARDRMRPPVPDTASWGLPTGVRVVVGGEGELPWGDLAQGIVACFEGRAPDVAVVTTACGFLPIDLEPLVAALGDAGCGSVSRIDAVSRTVADSEAFARALADHDVVWFAGDRPWLLLDRYEGTRTARALRDRSRDGRTLVLGASGYAAHALGSVLLRGHPLDSSVLVAEGYAHGLGLVPRFAIETDSSSRVFASDEGGPSEEDLHAPHARAMLCVPPGQVVWLEGSRARAAVESIPGSVLSVADGGRARPPLVVTLQGVEWAPAETR